MKLLVLVLAALAAGCGGGGGTGPAPDVLKGAAVGALAERQLEAQNPTMSPGTLACPDVDFTVGASVRCLRTTELSAGRVVKVEGTVAVTSTASGGRLHVTMDDQPLEFGLNGSYVATDLRQRYAARFHRDPTRLECPYLRGAVGTRVSCHLEAEGTSRDVDVVVTAVDPTTFATTYQVASGTIQP